MRAQSYICSVGWAHGAIRGQSRPRTLALRAGLRANDSAFKKLPHLHCARPWLFGLYSKLPRKQQRRMARHAKKKGQKAMVVHYKNARGEQKVPAPQRQTSSHLL